MAKKTSSRATAQTGSRRASLFRPWLLTAAFALFWAAAHQPAGFSPVGTIVWLLGALTWALLVRAGLACLEPAVKLLVMRLRDVMPRGDTP
jgi:hypothetical protein